MLPTPFAFAEEFSRGTALGVGFAAISYGLVLVGAAYLMDCVRETTKNTRFLVPEATRPTRSYAGLAVVAGLVGVAGVVSLAIGVIAIIGALQYPR